MKERSDESTPKIIKQLLYYPYFFFSFNSRPYKKLMDIAAGDGSQLFITKKHYTDIVMLDAEPTDIVKKADILNFSTLEQYSPEVIFCFETIEHLKSKGEIDLAINNLIRLNPKIIIIGSIDKNAPKYIDGVEIYLGDRNPFHFCELTSKEFDYLYPFDYRYYSIYYHHFFGMVRHKPAIKHYCNYGVIINE